MKCIRFALLIGLVFWGSRSGFAAVQSGRMEKGVFQAGEHLRLRYLLATPPRPSHRIFLFVHGDGDTCAPMDVEESMRDLSRVADQDYWVLPETAHQAFCNSGGYRRLNWVHRYGETVGLIRQFRNDPRFAHFQIYMVGHSAGVDVAVRVARDHSEELSGMVLISGMVHGLKDSTYRKLALDGERSGASKETIEKRIERKKQLFWLIESRCDVRRFDWLDRNNLFWCQWFQGDNLVDLLDTPRDLPIFLMHGDEDGVIPFEESKITYARLRREKWNVEFLPLRGMDHNAFPFPEGVTDQISLWAGRYSRVR
ncbi:MAG: alpha/beta hydrolase [Cryobacterium sp.]|nr:alpha/beta hydrolase [Oligoflexia bacterium]